MLRKKEEGKEKEKEAKFHLWFCSGGQQGGLNPTDIIAIVDSSGSINSEEYELQKNALMVLADSIGIGKPPYSVRMGVVQFESFNGAQVRIVL